MRWGWLDWNSSHSFIIFLSIQLYDNTIFRIGLGGLIATQTIQSNFNQRVIPPKLMTLVQSPVPCRPGWLSYCTKAPFSYDRHPDLGDTVTSPERGLQSTAFQGCLDWRFKFFVICSKTWQSSQYLISRCSPWRTCHCRFWRENTKTPQLKEQPGGQGLWKPCSQVCKICRDKKSMKGLCVLQKGHANPSCRHSCLSSLKRWMLHKLGKLIRPLSFPSGQSGTQKNMFSHTLHRLVLSKRSIDFPSFRESSPIMNMDQYGTLKALWYLYIVDIYSQFTLKQYISLQKAGTVM